MSSPAPARCRISTHRAWLALVPASLEDTFWTTWIKNRVLKLDTFSHVVSVIAAAVLSVKLFVPAAYGDLGRLCVSASFALVAGFRLLQVLLILTWPDGYYRHRTSLVIGTRILTALVLATIWLTSQTALDLVPAAPPGESLELYTGAQLLGSFQWRGALRSLLIRSGTVMLFTATAAPLPFNAALLDAPVSCLGAVLLAAPPAACELLSHPGAAPIVRWAASILRSVGAAGGFSVVGVALGQPPTRASALEDALVLVTSTQILIGCVATLVVVYCVERSAKKSFLRAWGALGQGPGPGHEDNLHDLLPGMPWMVPLLIAPVCCTVAMALARVAVAWQGVRCPGFEG